MPNDAVELKRSMLCIFILLKVAWDSCLTCRVSTSRACEVPSPQHTAGLHCNGAEARSCDCPVVGSPNKCKLLSSDSVAEKYDTRIRFLPKDSQDPSQPENHWQVQGQVHPLRAHQGAHVLTRVTLFSSLPKLGEFYFCIQASVRPRLKI